MAKQRNHKAEYQRRIANAARRGLSRSQARGHAKAGEKSIRKPRAKNSERLETALKAYRKTGRQVDAARSVGVSVELLRRYLRENVSVKRQGRTLIIDDNRPREMTIYSRGEKTTVILPSFEAASINGEHENAVKTYILTGDDSLLQNFEGRSVFDMSGKEHPFETDLNILHRLYSAGTEPFHNIYRLIT